MENHRAESLITILVALVVAALIGMAGSQGGTATWGMPLYALCGLLAFAINWIAFVPAYARRTEHFYDLVGSITYLAVVTLAVVEGAKGDPRSLLLAGMICVWAARLGSFLFLRVRRVGKDERFDSLKADALRFLMAWTLQALWVFVTLACALAAITAIEKVPLSWAACGGVAMWGLGFAFEVIADRQKRAFRSDETNHGRFIQTGLWAWSRHPNYFGEITLWAGIAILAAPGLQGWQLATLVSPLFVYLLLTRVSGIPLLQARALERWGDDPAYQAYLRDTPALVPRRPRSSLP